MNKFQRNIYRTVFENEIPIISCSETTSSGGVGVTEYTLMLDKPLGGIVIMDFDPQGVPDKLEIIHNGVKKATSGMTVANSGPFDNIYGEPTIPDTTQAIATDQFIGTIKGAVPNRDSIFLSETGITDIVRTKQQLIWWVYTQTDYELLNNVIVRVTGIDNTAWTLQRLCTDQTPTGVDPTPDYTLFGIYRKDDPCGIDYEIYTLDSTGYFYYKDGESYILASPFSWFTFDRFEGSEYVWVLQVFADDTTYSGAEQISTCPPTGSLESGTISSESQGLPDSGCENLILNTNCWIYTSTNGMITSGDIVYSDVEGTTPIIGGNLYYKISLVNTYIVLIENNGVISVHTICA